MVAQRKLDMVDYATRLSDLASPPGNRLEALKGDRKGQHSIRINDQWSVCFRWTRTGRKTLRSRTTTDKAQTLCPASAHTPARSCARSISRR